MVVGDLHDTDEIAECLHGCGAVISAPGHNRIKVQGDRPAMHGLSNIVVVMNQSDIRRLMQISTAAHRDPEDAFAFNVRAFALLFWVIARQGFEDSR